MKIVKNILMLLFFCACANVAEMQGQEKVLNEENKVLVYLNNGSKFEAKLLEWNTEEDIMIFDVYGSPVKFSSKDVKKMISLKANGSVAYNFKETGLYYHLRMNLITGNPGNRSNFQPGVGLSASVGKRMNRLLSYGVGIGFDHYIIRSSENILSTFGEVSGYFHESNQSLSYNVAAGYGFAYVASICRA